MFFANTIGYDGQRTRPRSKVFVYFSISAAYPVIRSFSTVKLRSDVNCVWLSNVSHDGGLTERRA